MKRKIALLLAMIMVLSILPVNVFADSTNRISGITVMLNGESIEGDGAATFTIQPSVPIEGDTDVAVAITINLKLDGGEWLFASREYGDVGDKSSSWTAYSDAYENGGVSSADALKQAVLETDKELPWKYERTADPSIIALTLSHVSADEISTYAPVFRIPVEFTATVEGNIKLTVDSAVPEVSSSVHTFVRAYNADTPLVKDILVYNISELLQDGRLSPDYDYENGRIRVNGVTAVGHFNNMGANQRTVVLGDGVYPGDIYTFNQRLQSWDSSYGYEWRENEEGGKYVEIPVSSYFSFDVSGDSTVTVYAISANSSDTTRAVRLSDADGNIIGEEPALIHSNINEIGQAINFEYKGPATTLYVSSIRGNINFFYISASNGIITEDEYEAPATPTPSPISMGLGWIKGNSSELETAWGHIYYDGQGEGYTGAAWNSDKTARIYQFKKPENLDGYIDVGWRYLLAPNDMGILPYYYNDGAPANKIGVDVTPPNSYPYLVNAIMGKSNSLDGSSKNMEPFTVFGSTSDYSFDLEQDFSSNTLPLNVTDVGFAHLYANPNEARFFRFELTWATDELKSATLTQTITLDFDYFKDSFLLKAENTDEASGDKNSDIDYHNVDTIRISASPQAEGTIQLAAKLLAVSEIEVLPIAESPIVWKSSNVEAATVDSTGLVTFTGGTSVITATITKGGNAGTVVGSFTIAEPIALEPITFPDPNFEAAVRGVIYKPTGDIYKSDVEQIGYLNVENRNISDLTGIEYFDNLNDLSCAYNELTALDVSKNTKLTSLRCQFNKISELDVSKNTELQQFFCDGNEISELDVSQNSQLVRLNCYENNLTVLDVSENSQLEYFNCHNNPLTELDVSQNPKLYYIHAARIPIEKIDLTKNPELKMLYVNSCSLLTELDITQNPNMTLLHCFNSKLTELDISQNPLLTEIQCRNNLLTSLDVTNNPVLSYLDCKLNYIPAEDDVIGLDRSITTQFIFHPQKWVEDNGLYTVTFKDYDGTVLDVQKDMENGMAAEAPEDPEREGYAFTGWDKVFDNVTSNLTVFAEYTALTYTVVFKDHDGTELKTQTGIQHGFSALAPPEPMRSGYVFTGWDKAFAIVKEDLTVTALYEETEAYTVVFTDYDGTVLKTQRDIVSGTAAEAPPEPSRQGYDFAGWDKAFNNVTSNMTVTATYAKKANAVYIEETGTYNLENNSFFGDYIIEADSVIVQSMYLQGNLYIYANNVTIQNGTIQGNVIIAGKNVTIRSTHITGNVFVSSDNAVIENGSIKGNLTVEKTVGDGNLTLKENMYVSDTIYIYGGGSNSIIIEDSEIGTVEIDKPKDAGSQPVSVKAQGTTKIASTKVKSTANLINTTTGSDGGLGEVELAQEIPANSSVVLNGAFSSVSVAAGSISVELPKDTVIEKLDVIKTASDTAFVGGGEIESALISADTAVTFANPPQNTTQLYTITATAGDGGTITPSGEVSVEENASQTFTITPDTGYEILSVIVDEESQGVTGTYTFSEVIENHTIDAEFKARDLAVSDDGSTITVKEDAKSFKSIIKLRNKDTEEVTYIGVEKQ